VDIRSDEIITATCEVLNTFTSKVGLVPVFETHFRTMFGNVVDQIGGATSTIAVQTGTSSISFELPKATQPQAYSVSTSLINDDKSVISNSVVFHYVLRGASGTIQNTVFDKSYYAKGDVAHLQIFTSPSADMFPDSRLGYGTNIVNQTLGISIADKLGISCASTQSQVLNTNDNVINTSILITKDCTDPTAKIAFSGGSSTASSSTRLLDSKEFQAISTTTLPLFTPKNNSPMVAIIAIIGGLILLVLILIIHKRYANNKKINSIFVLACILTASAIFSEKIAYADTVVVVDGSYDFGYNDTYTVNLNKSSYAPGATIYVAGSVSSNRSASFNAYLSIENTRLDDLSPGVVLVPSSGHSGTGSATFVAPSSPGNHRVTTNDHGLYFLWTSGGYILDPEILANQTIPFTVVQPPNTPTSLSATTGGCGTNLINLSWNEMSGATSYKIYRNSVFDKSVNQPSSGTVATTSDSGLTSGQQYQYSVSAVNAYGESASSTSISQYAPGLCSYFIDIGLRVNQGTQASPNIQHIAIESITNPPATPSKLRIAKNGTIYNVALVDPTDANATKVLVKLADGSIKAIRSCTSTNGCQYVP
jgi:hypothetical protein